MEKGDRILTLLWVWYYWRSSELSYNAHDFFKSQ